MTHFAILSISRAILKLPVGGCSSSFPCYEELASDMIYTYVLANLIISRAFYGSIGFLQE